MSGFAQVPSESPGNLESQQRYSLYERFAARLTVNARLDPLIATYQGHRDEPGFRWLKFKEGFSARLVNLFLNELQPRTVLDPFSGIGTVPVIASGRGLEAIGIEIMPVGNLAANALSSATSRVSLQDIIEASNALIRYIEGEDESDPQFCYPHVTITEAAFPRETELALTKAREFLANVADPGIHTMLNFACMSILESVSYTRKDGQYLRWDHRSGKSHSNKAYTTSVLPFLTSLKGRLTQIHQDIPHLQSLYGQGSPQLFSGSCLELLPKLSSNTIDLVITSPPYPNRYDYTRTYALELAWLGCDDEALKSLRQRLLSTTVESKSKLPWLSDTYGDSATLNCAVSMYKTQGSVREIIQQLTKSRHSLSNPNVIRMLEGYFIEMAIVVTELGRIVRPGGTVIMVNDNVQYHGEQLPVDLILADYAEQVGFVCEDIWVLPRRKGNASQQMARFGRRHMRKCVFRWVRRPD